MTGSSADDGLRERVARAICAADGVDPDQLCPRPGAPSPAARRSQRAVCVHRLGRFRDRSLENQTVRAAALNLDIAVFWNTVYLGRDRRLLRLARRCPWLS